MKLVLLMIIMFLSSFNYATVGQNNLQITVGGNMNYTKTVNNTAWAGIKPKNEYIGGGFDITLGHLYLSQGALIHGFDTKARFAMNFSPLTKVNGEKFDPEAIGYDKYGSTTLNTSGFSLGTTYMIGNKLGKGRLMINVLGLNLGYLSATYTNIKISTSTTYSTHINKYADSFLLGVELPLGIQYIFDNGLSLGFSHRLDFSFGKDGAGTPDRTIDGDTITDTYNKSAFGSGDGQASYLAYNLTVRIGYVFGK